MQPAGWDAVIVNYNGALFLDPCLRALANQDVRPGHVVVVDNASTDDSLTELAGWPQADTISSRTNLGYAGGANLGISSCEAPVVVVLNPDVELDPSFGRELLRLFNQNASLGAAGARLRYPESDRIQHAGGEVVRPALTTRHRGEGEPDGQGFQEPQDADYVTGAALALGRRAFEHVGGFDEAFIPAYWEDVDLCWRLRDAGWAVRYEPTLTAVHHEGSGLERGDDYFLHWTRNRLRFAAKQLSHEEWWERFVPAELERLRGELSAVQRDSWPVRSGASAIEQLARSGSLDAESFSTGLQADRLVDSIQTIRELPSLADPRPRELGPGDGVLRRAKRFLSRFSGRIYAEELYWQQRQFNEQVVRVLEAQDRLNRESIVHLLYALLLIGHQPREERPESVDWDSLIPPGPPYDGA